MSKDVACPSSFKLPGIFLGLLFSFLTACNTQSPVQFSQSKATQPIAAKPAKILYDTNVIKPDSSYNKLVVEFQNDLLNNEFAAIEKKAELAIKNKERLEGGSWKIRLIVDALGIPVNRLLSSEDEWRQHFARIEVWKKQFPNSITAYNALAASYTSYGEQARGQGYANTVTAENAKLHKQRLGLSRPQTLSHRVGEFRPRFPFQ